MGLEATAPIRRLQIADVGDRRRRTKIWWWREAPAHHRQFALAIRCGANNRGQCVWKDGWKAWEITRQVAFDPKEAAHGLLVAGDTVEVAHSEIEGVSPALVKQRHK